MARPGTSGLRKIARFRSFDVCATFGCGDLASPGSIYCAECIGLRASHVEHEGPADSAELDVVSFKLLERLGIGHGKRRRVGQGWCIHPDCDQPTVAGRAYCSTRCRGRGKRRQPVIEIDGHTGTLRQHCERLGLSIGTVYARMRAGMEVHEALTVPVDEEMRRRRVART